MPSSLLSIKLEFVLPSLSHPDLATNDIPGLPEDVILLDADADFIEGSGSPEPAPKNRRQRRRRAQTELLRFESVMHQFVRGTYIILWHSVLHGHYPLSHSSRKILLLPEVRSMAKIWSQNKDALPFAVKRSVAEYSALLGEYFSGDRGHVDHRGDASSFDAKLIPDADEIPLVVVEMWNLYVNKKR